MSVVIEMEVDLGDDAKVDFIEHLLLYLFRSKDLVVEALTAAGADEQKYDGNRRLVQIGISLIEFVTVYTSCHVQISRGIGH